MEEVRNECMVLVGKPDRKRLLGMSRSRWKDNIKIGLKNEDLMVLAEFVSDKQMDRPSHLCFQTISFVQNVLHVECSTFWTAKLFSKNIIVIDVAVFSIP